MSSAPSSQEIAADARWLAQAMDAATSQVRLIEMDREAYRSASFLDDRMLQSPVDAQYLPWAEVAAALPAGGRRDARWIFHIGHVGSTLIARLLGALPGVLSIREPRLLRDLVAVEAARRSAMIGTVQALVSRTFDPAETAVVKATSFVSEIAAELVQPGGRALFLHASPRAYLGTILAGENSLKELAMLADSRAERMAGRVPGLAVPPTQAHQAAAAWACEMTALEAAAEAMKDRAILWADFDVLLADISGGLRQLADFLGLPSDPAAIDGIVRGPLLSRYSKALEYKYSPALRRDLIAEALTRNADEVDDALAMLARAAQDSPLLARALSRSPTER